MTNFCDTCCHQFSDICGGCESLDGVPVKYSEKKKTNADRIRAMSDEELADLLSCSMCSLCVLHYYCKENRNNRNCDDVILEWLKQEAKT